MKILVTGAAGFIGMHVTQRLLARGDEVIGIDNLNDYYDVNLKLARLEMLKSCERFRFEKADIAERDAMSCLASRILLTSQGIGSCLRSQYTMKSAAPRSKKMMGWLATAGWK